MNSVLRRVATALVEYEWYRIYVCDHAQGDELAAPELNFRPVADVAEIEGADPALRALAHYSGVEAAAFGVWRDNTLLGVAWVWWGERYRARQSWPIACDEAKLVQVTVNSDSRGAGLAPRLIRYAASQMLSRGFRRVYARIWHSHRASIRAFEKAGWQRRGTLVRVRARGRTRSLTFFRKR
jgi:GNAT superfamily N-acetyltransferase